MGWKKPLFFIVGIALILLVLNSFGLEETVSTLQHTNVEFLFIAAAIQIFSMVLLSTRLRLLLEGMGFVSFIQLLRVSMTGLFISLITPFARLGGEPLKMYMLRNNVGNNNASAAVAAESVMELLSTVMVVFVILVLFFGSIPPAYVTTFLVFLVIISIGLAIMMKVIFTARWLNKVVNGIATRMAKALGAEKKDYARLFSSSFYRLMARKTNIYSALGISIGMKILETIRLWIVFMALGTFLPLQSVVVIWTIILVLSFIPWLPGSLGLVEFGGIAAIIAFGVPAGVAASAMILDRLLSFWMPLGIGAFAMNSAREHGEMPKILN